MKNYIDFKSKPSSSQYGPVCNDLELPTDLIIDTLPGLSNRGRLDYSAETGLKMVRYANVKNDKSVGLFLRQYCASFLKNSISIQELLHNQSKR